MVYFDVYGVQVAIDFLMFSSTRAMFLWWVNLLVVKYAVGCEAGELKLCRVLFTNVHSIMSYLWIGNEIVLTSKKN